MRNAVIARDPVAQAAGEALIAAGGTATDMALAALLAGAARSSPASLLGAAGILVAGTGAGAHFIDGRARAPGLGEKRPRTPDDAPEVWRAAVPGLLEGALAAHARFGTLPLAEVARAAVNAVRDDAMDDGLAARVKLLQQLHRTGIHALERLGVLRGVLLTAGPLGGGVFTRDDLVPVPAPVRELPSCVEGPHEVLVPPRRSGRYGPNAPEPLGALPVESVVAMDMHGVAAVASWVAAPAAAEIHGVEGLALAALMPKARRGVPRWRPGAALPVPLPTAVLLHERRAWAAVGLSGGGDLVAARDRAVQERLRVGGVTLELGEGDGAPATRDAVALWAVREADGEVRTSMAAVS